MGNTNQPFDVRVVNSLERPTIDDFNQAQQAQRTTSQLLAQTIWDAVNYDSSSGMGFCGSGFKVVSTGGLFVAIRAGIGFVRQASGTAVDNIGGITGVDISSAVPTYPLYLATDLEVQIDSPPSAGQGRRDIIAVRNLNVGELSDYQASNIFNPANQTFTPQLVPKTYTWQLNNSDVERMPTGGSSTATKPLAYIPGVVQPYTQPDDFLTMLPSTVPNGYTILAVINIAPDSTISNGKICDYRPLIFANRSLSFPLQFIGGAVAGVPGERLENYNRPQLPNGLDTPVITKTGLGTSNRYALTLLGYFNARSIVATLSAGGSVFDGNSTFRTYANMVTTTEIKVPQVGTYSPLVSQTQLTEADVAVLNDPAKSQPAAEYAVGQPYCQVAFALGYTDLSIPGMNYQGTTFDSTGTESRLISGTVTISY